MKNNWSNPELKNLSVESTNEELQCESSEGRDGNHWLLKCHHGLYADGDLAMVTCPYKEYTLVGVIRCTYKDAVTPGPAES